MNYIKKSLCFLLLSVVAVVSCKKDKDGSPSEINKESHRQAVGESANDLLAGSNYDRMVVEVQYFSGHRPTDEAMQALEVFLNERLNKGDGISLEYKELTSGSKDIYSVADIVAVEDANRSRFTGNKTITAYLLFLDGEYSGNSGDSKVLGVAYRNTSMAIFEKTIHSLSDGIMEPPRHKLETTVVNHEFGHILGLVNVGTNMQVEHQDEDHGHHCDNADCLMNWVAETGDVVDNLLGSKPIPTLDQNCLNDLKANGGK